MSDRSKLVIAGGHLALFSTAKIKFSGLLLLSPWIRPRQTLCSLRSNAKYDWLTAQVLREYGELYLGTQDSPAPPAIDLPRTLLVVGQREILVEDAVSWICIAEDNKVKVKIVVQPGQVHGFCTLRDLCTSDTVWQRQTVAQVEWMCGIFASVL